MQRVAAAARRAANGGGRMMAQRQQVLLQGPRRQLAVCTLLGQRQGQMQATQAMQQVWMQARLCSSSAANTEEAGTQAKEDTVTEEAEAAAAAGGSFMDALAPADDGTLAGDAESATAAETVLSEEAQRSFYLSGMPRESMPSSEELTAFLEETMGSEEPSDGAALVEKVEIFPNGAALVQMSSFELSERAKQQLEGAEWLAGTLATAPAMRQPNVSEREQRVYVGNLPFHVTWQEISDHFSNAVGKVTFIRMMRDRAGRFRGNAIVTFESAEDATKALTLDNTDFQGRNVHIQLDHGLISTQGCRVLLNNLPAGSSEDAIAEFVAAQTSEAPVNVRLLYESEETQPKRAILLFNSPEAASQAVNALDSSSFDDAELHAQLILRGRAQRRRGPSDRQQNWSSFNECTVFVANVAYTTAWPDLAEHMEQAGPVRRTHILTDQYGRSRGVARVTYDSADSAQRAIAMLNDSHLAGRHIAVREHVPPARFLGQRTPYPSAYSGGYNEGSRQRGGYNTGDGYEQDYGRQGYGHGGGAPPPRSPRGGEYGQGGRDDYGNPDSYGNDGGYGYTDDRPY